MDEELIRFRIRLGLRIRELRLSINLEQIALASKLNRDKQFINRYELEGREIISFATRFLDTNWLNDYCLSDLGLYKNYLNYTPEEVKSGLSGYA